MRKQSAGLPAAVVLCTLAAFSGRAAESEGHVAQSEKDKEMVAKQGASYPLKSCVITGEGLVEGEAVDYIYKDRLVRFCCKGCIKKFEAEPAKYLALLDKAAKDAPPVKAKSDTGAVKEAPAAQGGCGGCEGCADGVCR